MAEVKIGNYLTLEDFCNCTNTYKKYSQQIESYPKNLEVTIPALEALARFILDPIIERFSHEKFKLTYGFCSPSLRKYLDKKDINTGVKNGRIDPQRDQHMAGEVKINGRYYCDRLGAACDFQIVDTNSDRVVEWILRSQLPFDSMYYYGEDRPIHISYGPQHKRDIWTFGEKGQPTKKGLENWLELVKRYSPQTREI
ncbi:hypothetical protein [Aliterella atlantica]|uniref:Peptidase M15A C-terminal domain-containing protein n=1 Tax=Aliterella atlantica CENA595 TaxID=1618023 RepID=A0A0D8ZRY9_9CYAN|nr:hypothetical protein [Aliterella atlantica]KJH69971.1 hypothetical protein UH38_20795 [Aliterella atlantica CENA595]